MIKRKKNTRMRGSTTHGHGSMKKRRGAGHRGGRGRAGSGKRADTKKPSIWKNKKYFGRAGFKYKGSKQSARAINLSVLEEQLDTLVTKKMVAKEGNYYTVDLPKLGYQKLLSKGKLTKKCKVTVPYASKRAIEVVQAAGGEVTGLLTKKK